MKIDFTKWSKELAERDVSCQLKNSDRGLSKVIMYVINQFNTKEVDWNSFTQRDAYRAFEEGYYMPNSDDDEDTAALEEEIKQNNFYMYAQTETVVAAFVHQTNIQIMNDDDFI